MKKVTALFLAILTSMSIIIASTAIPSMAKENIRVLLNGNILSFDVPPQIINDRTMVPMRTIFEALGAQVDWNQDTKTVVSTKGDTIIKLTIDKDTMYVNDTEVVLDSPACIINNRTLVPVRAISEALSCGVLWDDKQKMVSIFSSEEERQKYVQKLDLCITILTELQSMYLSMSDCANTMSEYTSSNSDTTIAEAKNYVSNAIQNCKNILSLTENQEINTLFNKVLSLENDLYNQMTYLPYTMETVVNDITEILPLTENINISMIILGYDINE